MNNDVKSLQASWLKCDACKNKGIWDWCKAYDRANGDVCDRCNRFQSNKDNNKQSNMNKQEIETKIKELEEQLSSLKDDLKKCDEHRFDGRLLEIKVYDAVKNKDDITYFRCIKCIEQDNRYNMVGYAFRVPYRYDEDNKRRIKMFPSYFSFQRYNDVDDGILLSLEKCLYDIKVIEDERCELDEIKARLDNTLCLMECNDFSTSGYKLIKESLVNFCKSEAYNNICTRL